jgi:hypothetical protein
LIRVGGGVSPFIRGRSELGSTTSGFASATVLKSSLNCPFGITGYGEGSTLGRGNVALGGGVAGGTECEPERGAAFGPEPGTFIGVDGERACNTGGGVVPGDGGRDGTAGGSVVGFVRG